jgi:hypothetical protein
MLKPKITCNLPLTYPLDSRQFNQHARILKRRYSIQMTKQCRIYAIQIKYCPRYFQHDVYSLITSNACFYLLFSFWKKRGQSLAQKVFPPGVRSPALDDAMHIDRSPKKCTFFFSTLVQNSRVLVAAEDDKGECINALYCIQRDQSCKKTFWSIYLYLPESSVPLLLRLLVPSYYECVFATERTVSCAAVPRYHAIGIHRT